MTSYNLSQDQSGERIPHLLTIRQMAQKHPFMTENSIRWLIFKSPPGLEDCLVRVSRRIFIDESKYFNFLKQLKHHPC